jgi:hypothetical protein
MRTATWRSSGLLARTFVEITNLYLLVVPHLQHLPSGFAPCLTVMVAKKLNWRESKTLGVNREVTIPTGRRRLTLDDRVGR